MCAYIDASAPATFVFEFTHSPVATTPSRTLRKHLMCVCSCTLCPIAHSLTLIEAAKDHRHALMDKVLCQTHTLLKHTPRHYAM